MFNWYHITKGRYGIQDKNIILDYSKLFLNPKDAQITLVHEITHSSLSSYEFGQAAHFITKIEKSFNHLNRQDRKRLLYLIYSAQEFTQEGLATLMQVLVLSKNIGKKDAIDWAKNNLPVDYYERFKNFLFVFKLSNRYIDFFTTKIFILSMSTGIRATAQKIGIFNSVESLENYLLDPSHSPDSRLKKIIDILSYKPWLLTKTQEEIAQAAKISFFPPATKEEVASFQNYLLSLAGINNIQFKSSDIKDAPSTEDAYKGFLDNTVIGNLNINLVETAEPLSNLKDFLWYSNVTEVIFITPLNEEAGLIAFTKTGEKYLLSTTFEKAVEIINNQFVNTTLFVKPGVYDILTNTSPIFPKMRSPNLVVYNKITNLEIEIDNLLKNFPALRLEHISIGSSPEHPFTTLILRVVGSSTFHVINTFSGFRLPDFIRKITPFSTNLNSEDLVKEKDNLNNLFSVWMGLPWQVDWIKSMIDGKNIFPRL